MASSSSSWFAVLVVASLVVLSSAAVDSTDHAKGKAFDSAAAAHESAQTWSEVAKEKLSSYAADAKHTVENTMGMAKDTAADNAAAAQDHTQSYLDMAKEKLSAFTTYVFSTVCVPSQGYMSVD